MTTKTRGRKAANPPPNYSRPEMIAPGGATVTYTSTSGEVTVFRLAPDGHTSSLLVSLAEAFAACFPPSGGWHSPATQEDGQLAVASFYRYTQSLTPPLRRVEQITPDVVRGYRAHNGTGGSGRVKVARTVLQRVAGLPDETRTELRKRIPHIRSKMKKGLTTTEFRLVMSACWRVFDDAHSRIQRNVSRLSGLTKLVQDEAATTDERELLAAWTALLEDPRALGASHLEDHGRRTFRGTELANVDTFYLNTLEGYAALLLFAGLEGFTPGMLYELSSVHERPDGGVGSHHVFNVKLTKPRRGPRLANSRASLVDRGPRSPGGLYRRLLEATEPARSFLQFNGLNEPGLVLVASRRGDYSAARSFLTGERIVMAFRNISSVPDWMKTMDADGNIHNITPSLMRHSLQVLKREPAWNTENTHDQHYVLRDVSTAAQSVDLIVRGQQDLVEHAETTMALRVLSDSEIERAVADPGELAGKLGVSVNRIELLLAGRLDTPVASCLDQENSPFNSGSCRVSFLMCLACENAVVTSLHLPNLLAIVRVFESVGAAVSTTTWQLDYRVHYDRLQQLLNLHFTAAEISTAQKSVGQAQVECAERLLNRGFDI